MGEHWDPWNQGASPGGQRWGPPGGSPTPADPRGGGFPAPDAPPPVGYAPGGGTPGGVTPGGFRPDDVHHPDSRPDPGQLSDLIGTPPRMWLLAALVLGLVAAVVALVLGASVAYAVAAWVLAGPVAIGLLAVFTQQDVKQRSMPIYAAPEWLPALYWSAVVAAGVGVLASAWSIAEWAGHQ